ncbi:hypothetical protein L484_026343 [Morus notabilis]|uniref:Uncharacterized protein n=1 Tax=Morus notabilis TaxID=981085 RepID=W9R606_9ROSA|nr:hypothetical protein L484_026343 [Morus notabilis]
MRKFDPWPVFFRREWNRNWPFLFGFAITGTIITKFSLGLTEAQEALSQDLLNELEQKTEKASQFPQRKKLDAQSFRERQPLHPPTPSTKSTSVNKDKMAGF